MREKSERLRAERETVVELGQADEDEGQQRAAVPLVIEEDVQVVERVLVKEVRLVEEEDGVEALAAEIFDVGADGEEDGRGGGGRREAEGEAELAIEVAAAERGVMAVGETEAGLRQAMAEGAQHARLADAGLAGEDALEACSSTASCSSSTTDCLEGGSQRSASAISLEKGLGRG